jgi:hypothetical protein
VEAVEHGIADVFSALQGWLVSAGAVDSMVRLAWAVLSVLWLGHVAVAFRPGREPDIVAVFGRLIVAGGLLASVGSVTRVVITGFEAVRGAGAAVLNGLIGENWSQFVSGRLVPQFNALFSAASGWLAYPWALTIIAVGILLGLVLFGVGSAVYLAILFFAHLTLLLSLFLAPIAMALLAAPTTQRWTARWAMVIVRAGLLVFTVRLIHAAVLYLAVVVPVREVARDLDQALAPGTPSGEGVAAVVGLLLRLARMLLLMLVGTGVGVYTMLRAERLTGQFVDGIVLAEAALAGPARLQGQVVAWYNRSGGGDVEPTVAGGGRGGPDAGPWGPASGPDPGTSGTSAGGGAQDATVMRPGGRIPG